jgi:sugar phosphate isomerase/epimerase
MIFTRRAFVSTIAMVAPGFSRGVSGPGLKAGATGERLGASIACLAGRSLTEAIDEVARLGFPTLELITYAGARHSGGSIPGFWFHALNGREQQALYDATRRFRHISAHMPFQDLHLFSYSLDVRAFSFDQIVKALDGLAFVRGEVAVVHAGALPPGTTYRDVWPLMLDVFRRLGDQAAKRKLRVGIETMQPDTSDDYVRLIHEIGHPNVGATIDTGHIRGAKDLLVSPNNRGTPEVRTAYNRLLAKIIERLGDRVVHYHLSDVRATDWADHRTLGSGIVDFGPVLRAASLQSRPPLLVMELEEPDGPAALAASRSHLERIS